MAIFNNPGNILFGQNFAGETGEYYIGKENKLKYAIFDSPEMGLRALYKDVQTKLKNSGSDVEDALLRYLGGDNIEDTKEERYIRAATDNIDPKGYIQRGIKAWDTEGQTGLVKQIIENENLPEHRKYYLDNTEAIDTAEKLSIMDLPSGTTFENALKIYQQEYPRKEGGMISRNPYPHNPRPI